MKHIILFFSLLFSVASFSQGTVKYTAGISYGTGVPTYTPTGSVSKKYINLTTLRSYTYSGTSWVIDGNGIDVVSGCAAPAYTPGPGQSNIVINNCTLLQNGQGPELYVFDGTSWIFINEKSTAPIYTAGDGIDITGSVITNTAPDQVVGITGAGINAVTGTYPNFTVTGTEVDGSTTNELQTLSISNDTLSISDGNAVVLPGGGGVTWPLIAPDLGGEVIVFKSEVDLNGGFRWDNQDFQISAEKNIVIYPLGNLSEGSEGYGFRMQSGDGDANGGNFLMSSGYGLNPVYGTGGQFIMQSADGPNGGGLVSITAGLNTTTFIREKINLTSFGVVFQPITEAERDAIPGKAAGMKIFCSDCTANDTSTGVEQTYNGSAWKNHW
jgi:hypothetical protein